MVLYIKNMVCARCVAELKAELEKIGLKRAKVSLGKISISERISPSKFTQLNRSLKKSGFELMDREQGVIVDKVKTILPEMVYYSAEDMKKQLPGKLSPKLNFDYPSLANLFIEAESTTIERFFIAHKIERVKELIIYYRLNPDEIAYQLNYSSTNELSVQFKGITGLTPCEFLDISNIL